MHSVNYINCNIIENLINKVLDVKPLVPFIITEYANSLTNILTRFQGCLKQSKIIFFQIKLLQTQF